jgi:CHAT domain-containing protein
LPLHAASASLSEAQSCYRYAVSSYTPTLTALLEARKSSKAPIATANIKALLVAEPSSPNCAYLHNVIDEINTAAKVLSATSPTRLVPGKEGGTAVGVSVNRVLEALPGTSVLHLACHGTQDVNDPLQSGFCLRDGVMTLKQLMRLHLPDAFFAYLSACETAKGDRKQPDQAVHLAAAMLFVGFRSIVATMWFVATVCHRVY